MKSRDLSLLFVSIRKICCILFRVHADALSVGMYSTDLYTFALNVITPVVLTAFGMILPQIAKREKR
jgi:hypothetical protein